MTVGESLTEARYQAGLSVDELSERTRIRDSVIRSIERDDYEACGGDLYVRGYVRAIAGAVGIDAQPLIQEFDQERVHAATGVGHANGDGGASGARPYVPLASATVAPSAPPSGDADATAPCMFFRDRRHVTCRSAWCRPPPAVSPPGGWCSSGS